MITDWQQGTLGIVEGAELDWSDNWELFLWNCGERETPRVSMTVLVYLTFVADTPLLAILVPLSCVYVLIVSSSEFERPIDGGCIQTRWWNACLGRSKHLHQVFTSSLFF